MDPRAAARAIFDANRFMTLATADARGRPWASPVWFASLDQREIFWVSSPDAQHSRNLTANPQVAMVIFDSQVPVGSAEAVYVAAVAEEVSGAELDRGIEVFSGVSRVQGLPEWTRADVVPPARHRLYRAVASEQFLLGEHDERVPVPLG